MTTSPITQTAFMEVIGTPQSRGPTALAYLNARDVAILSWLNKAFNEVLTTEKVCQRLLLINYPRSSIDPLLSFREQLQGLSHIPTNRDRGVHEVSTLKGHTRDIACLQMSTDGRWAISGSDDGILKLWDLRTGICLQTIQGHENDIRCLGMSVDGTRAISGSYDRTLKLWDLHTGKCLQILHGHTSAVSCLQMSSNARIAISGGEDSSLRLWNLADGTCLRTLEGHTKRISCLQMSNDGKRAISGSIDHTLRFWNLEDGTCLRILKEHQNEIRCLQMSADGKRAISGSVDKTCKLWDLETGKCLQTFEGHKFTIRCLQMTIDGKRAISGSTDYTIRLWDLETGKCLQILEGHTNPVIQLQMSSDGRRAFSGSEDNTIRLWDLETGKCLQTFQTNFNDCLQISADGKKVISGAEDTTLRVLDFSPTTEETLLKTARCFTTRSPEAQELFRGLPQSIQNGVYKELHSILGSSENYGELAFRGEKGFNATPEQRVKAISNYIRATFLRRIRTSLEQANTPITFQAALRRLSNLPEEMQAGVRPIFVLRLTEYFSRIDSPEKLRTALEIFSLLSPATKGAIYEELYRILGSPQNVPFNCGELAFHEKDGYTANNQQRAQAGSPKHVVLSI